MVKSSKRVKNYQKEFLVLQNYFELKIRKNKKNFTPSEKAKITKHINLLKSEGLIEYNSQKNKYIETVKFRKSKKKKEKIKGAMRSKGNFLRGAKPSDKVKGNKILGEYFDKILIPVDFEGAAEIDTEDGTKEFKQFIEQRLFDVLTPYFEEFKKEDYFTLVTANGWEIGRGRHKKRENKKGREYGRDWNNKLKVLTDAIALLLLKAIEKYEIDDKLISGIYWYHFKNQRLPTKKEVKKLKKRTK